MATDLFLSHDWGADGKTNHAKVTKINGALKKLGYTTWFDNERMVGNIKQQMADGIENTKCFIAFITERYHDKVVSGGIHDNCKLEFDYASNKVKMVAIVFEASMRNTKEWKGNVGMSLSSQMYVDMAGDLDNERYVSCQLLMLVKELSAIGIDPSKKNTMLKTNFYFEQNDLPIKSEKQRQGLTNIKNAKSPPSILKKSLVVKSHRSDLLSPKQTKNPVIAETLLFRRAAPAPSPPSNMNSSSKKSPRPQVSPGNQNLASQIIILLIAMIIILYVLQVPALSFRGVTIRNNLDFELSKIKVFYCVNYIEKENIFIRYVFRWPTANVMPEKRYDCSPRKRSSIRGRISSGEQYTIRKFTRYHYGRPDFSKWQIQFTYNGVSYAINKIDYDGGDWEDFNAISANPWGIDNDTIRVITLSWENDSVRVDFLFRFGSAYFYAKF